MSLGEVSGSREPRRIPTREIIGRWIFCSRPEPRTGLPVDTEVMDEDHLRLALDSGVDMLQVGTRNALNYSLLRQIGKSHCRFRCRGAP